MDGFLQDLRNAARSLVRRPGFTFLTVTTLGLGVGAATVIFSVVDTVILRPLPYDEPDRVVVMFNRDAVTGERRPGVSAANTRDFGEATIAFESVAYADPWSLDLRVDGRAQSLRTWGVSRGFFEAIGAEAELGRTFVAADYDDGGAGLVVMAHHTWVTRFGADPAIVGRTLALEGETRTVVGVLPSSFRFPDAAEMWIPRDAEPWDEPSRGADYLIGVGRLADGVSLEQARSDADRIALTLREAYPRVDGSLAFDLVPLREHLFGNVQTALTVLMAAVGFLLLIACANVAGLMLARGAQRERDYALRGALGAGTGRLISHVSAESLLIAAAGCAVGVVLAVGGASGIKALGPDRLPRIDELTVNGAVLAFALAVSALGAVVSGLAPSLRFSRPDLRSALGDGARGSAAASSQARTRSRLVVVQISATVVLLLGAGLLIRSFAILVDRELGFDPADRVVVQVFAYEYPDAGARWSFLEDAMAGMAALPGVTDVAMTTSVPSSNDVVISNIDINVPFVLQDRAAPPEGEEPETSVIQVSDGYFELMETDIVAGRSFTSADNADATPVVVINETLARRHFGSGDPIGERLLVRYGDEVNRPAVREIVGVVRDVRPLGHASAPRPEVYLPLRQFGSGSITFVLRANSNAEALVVPAMEAVWAANPAQSVWGATTVEGLVDEWLQDRRFSLALITAFSTVALALSVIGVYGLVSFSVERRRGELGVRRALGGRARDLLVMVMGEGLRLAGAGLVIGLGVGWYLTRFIRTMLFEIGPGDPWTLVGLGVVVLLIVAVGTLVPALRALRVDPVAALRSE